MARSVAMIVLLTPMVVFADEVNLRGFSATATCASVGSQCRGWIFNQEGCCPGSVCKQVGFFKKECFAQAETCVAEGGSCGGHDLEDQTCCGGGTCTNLLGGNGKVCVKKADTCVAEGDSCGGAGQRDLTCCGGAFCQQLLGGSDKQCVTKAETCVATGESCGGPGQRDLVCCGAAKCQNLLGGNGKTCVDLARTCVASGSVCGGPGQRDATCCGGAACQSLLGGSGEKKCVGVSELAVGGNGSSNAPVVNAEDLATLLDRSLANATADANLGAGDDAGPARCAAVGTHCAGPGEPSVPCCGGAACVHDLNDMFSTCSM